MFTKHLYQKVNKENEGIHIYMGHRESQLTAAFSSAPERQTLGLHVNSPNEVLNLRTIERCQTPDMSSTITVEITAAEVSDTVKPCPHCRQANFYKVCTLKPAMYRLCRALKSNSRRVEFYEWPVDSIIRFVALHSMVDDLNSTMHRDVSDCLSSK